MLAITLGLITPVQIAAQVWIIGFALGRFGHGFAYLTGRDGLRGICMSVSLIRALWDGQLSGAGTDPLSAAGLAALRPKRHRGLSHVRPALNPP